MFARKTETENYVLFHDSGQNVRHLADTPVIWPENSDLAACYDHPNGIELNPVEYAKIADTCPVED